VSKEYVQKETIKGEIEYERRRKERKPMEGKPSTTEVRREAKHATTLPILYIKLREARRVAVEKLKTPNIALKELKFPKLNIRPINVTIVKPLKLEVRIAMKEVGNVRVSIYEPLKIQPHSLLHPQIKMKPLRDFSVRPLLIPERIGSTKIKVSLPKVWPSLNLQPKLLPSVNIWKQLPLKPKLRLSEFLRGETPLRHGGKEESLSRVKPMEAQDLLEFPSLPESLVDERYLDEEYREFGGLGGVSTEGLVVILVDKSRDFHEFIKLLCTKLWRIKSEGLPYVSVRSYNDELYWYKLSEDVIELDKAQRVIEDLIHGDESILNRAKEEFVNQVKAKSIEGRLRFLLLPVDAKIFDKAYELLSSPELRIERYLRHAKFLAYKRKRVDEKFLARLLVSAFGFVELSPHSSSIGEYVLELHGKFCEELAKVIEKVRRRIEPVNWPEPKEGESWLHWALKHLAYMHLIENEGISEDSIKSEVSVIPGKVADVATSDIAIEIETMYGTGDPIGAKINPYTIRPYLEKNFKGELRLIIPNLHALLYTSSLLRLRKSYRRRGLNLEIYAVDVTGMGARLIYNEERKPGLVKLIDMLKFIKEGRINVKTTK